MKIKDILLVSDLDGTLIGENFLIPPRNIEAIRRFQRKGGHFSVATGRPLDATKRYFGPVVPNELCVLLNGSVIYDFKACRATRFFPIPAQAPGFAKRVAGRFPQAGVEAFRKDSQFVLRSNPYVTEHLAHEKIPYREGAWEDRGEAWGKVLFASDPETKARMHEFADSFPHPGVRFVETSEYYLEMLPEGINKGTGLDEVIRQTRYERKNVFAIGDYYNDIELLKTAGFAAVPANAPPEIRQYADFVTGHCRDGAVADLIEYLEENLTE